MQEQIQEAYKNNNIEKLEQIEATIEQNILDIKFDSFQSITHLSSDEERSIQVMLRNEVRRYKDKLLDEAGLTSNLTPEDEM